MKGISTIWQPNPPKADDSAPAWFFARDTNTRQPCEWEVVSHGYGCCGTAAPDP